MVADAGVAAEHMGWGDVSHCCVCRDAYEKIIEDLNIRPLKVQAGRNVIIKLQKGAEPEKVHTMDAEGDATA